MAVLNSRGGLIDVTITVRFMSGPSEGWTYHLPLPADLLDRRHDVRLLTQVAKQLLAGFAEVYTKAVRGG